ncbi:hypothetical protein OIU77_008740 [Salix suchowensis]|uniref:CASP-like protein n=1 Tax=Salix suchowensis TaxID=1278906 RepID=A0ABQ9ABY9_9ROSI|nr:hypothetical protein OIU77_008740 [Salix suchowensis]
MTMNTCHPLHLIFLNDHSIIMSSSSSSSLHRAASHQLAELGERERERERETMEKRDKGSSPMAMMGSGDENEDVKTTMRTAETLLRLVPMALCVSALVVMLKNSQTNDFGSLSYSDLGAFRYLVNANGICAGYSLLSAVIVAMPRPSTMPRAWTFFLT